MSGMGMVRALAALSAIATWGAGCAAIDVNADGDDAEEVGSIDRAIVGGDSSEPGEYAATGALVRGLSYRCTATLIAPDVAVTAAHCLADQGFGDFSFTLDADLSDGPDDLVPVLVYHQHPDFQVDGDELAEIGKRNDVGVIILAEPFDGVAVEQLDTGEQLASAPAALSSGMELALCGYGRAQWSEAGTSGVKRDAVVFVGGINEWELQTTGEDPQPCRGDSGGPVFARSGDGRRIAGLVSRATGSTSMCNTGAIFTRVAPYAEWIAEASRDRDTGCAIGGGGGGAVWPLVALLCALFARASIARRTTFARRGNRARRRPMRGQHRRDARCVWFGWRRGEMAPDSMHGGRARWRRTRSVAAQPRSGSG